MKHLLFNINNEKYAINVNNVVEIINYTELSPIPSSEPHVIGLLKIRSSVYTVFNSKVVFDLDNIGFDSGFVLVLDVNNFKVGFFVDLVDSVVDILDIDIQDPPSVGNNESSYVKGLVQINNKTVIIIDLSRIEVFNDEQDLHLM